MLQIDELLAAERREGMRRSTRGSLPVEGACDEPGEAEEEVEAGHRPEEKNVREGFGGTVAIYREQRREQRGQLSQSGEKGGGQGLRLSTMPSTRTSAEAGSQIANTMT
jgi:hypothetical protein